MTRLPVNLQPPPTPASVILGELGIATGIAAYSLTLVYRDYPAPLLCGQWKYLAESVNAEAVYHVHGQADVRKIAENINSLRLIFIHSPSHHHATVWAVQMASVNGDAPCPRPVILSRGSSPDIDEDPGATLLLSCNDDERCNIEQWLIAGNRRAAGWANAEHAIPVHIPPRFLNAVTQPLAVNQRVPARYRERSVLQGLLAGARLLGTSAEQAPADAPLTVTNVEYEYVRNLLQSKVAGPVDNLCDQLDMHMISRANVYLSVKYGDDSSEQNPFYEPDPSYAQLSARSTPPQPLITRREIADLGNTRSGMVRRLVEYLKQAEHGYDQFVQTGLQGHVPSQRTWLRRSAASLATLLRSWSAKQVRTHFDRLQQSGLITAERPQPNGPWLYALPEELTATTNGFSQLPPVA